MRRTPILEGVLHAVDEWQRHLIHIGALVRQEEPRNGPTFLTLRAHTTWIHDRDEQLGAGLAGVLTMVLRMKKRCRKQAAG